MTFFFFSQTVKFSLVHLVGFQYLTKYLYLINQIYVVKSKILCNQFCNFDTNYQKKYSASNNKDFRQTSQDAKAWFNRELQERFKNREILVKENSGFKLKDLLTYESPVIKRKWVNTGRFSKWKARLLRNNANHLSTLTVTLHELKNNSWVNFQNAALNEFQPIIFQYHKSFQPDVILHIN